MAQDLVAMWLDWSFRLADIAVPTRVWHAARDPHNDADTAAYAARIPGATRTVWPEAGHLGIVTHWSEVLGWAAAASEVGMTPPPK